MEQTTIRTTGGVGVTVHSVGDGPGLVILHGGAIGLREYGRLADALAERFTVHLYNRRGRPDAAPLDRRTYSIATDLADLAAVLEHTGAGMVFGHSGRRVRRAPRRAESAADPDRRVRPRPGDLRTALVRVPGRLLGGDRPGDCPRALSEMTRGVYPDSAAAKLPRALQRFASRLFLRTSVGRRMGELLPTVPPEVREIAAHDGPRPTTPGSPPRCCSAGGRSPRYFAENCAAVAQAIPRGRSVVLPRMPHNAANVAGPGFVTCFGDFFAGAARPVAS